jgi:hypothetical protein
MFVYSEDSGISVGRNAKKTGEKGVGQERKIGGRRGEDMKGGA